MLVEVIVNSTPLNLREGDRLKFSESKGGSKFEPGWMVDELVLVGMGSRISEWLSWTIFVGKGGKEFKIKWVPKGESEFESQDLNKSPPPPSLMF